MQSPCSGKRVRILEKQVGMEWSRKGLIQNTIRVIMQGLVEQGKDFLFPILSVIGNI